MSSNGFSSGFYPFVSSTQVAIKGGWRNIERRPNRLSLSPLSLQWSWRHLRGWRWARRIYLSRSEKWSWYLVTLIGGCVKCSFVCLTTSASLSFPHRPEPTFRWSLLLTAEKRKWINWRRIGKDVPTRGPHIIFMLITLWTNFIAKKGELSGDMET